MKKILILLVLVVFLVSCTKQTVLDKANELSECRTDSDCQSGYSCECTSVLPTCDTCATGACVATCVETVAPAGNYEDPVPMI